MKFIFAFFIILVTCSVYGNTLNGIVISEKEIALEDVNVINLRNDQLEFTNKYGRFTLDEVAIGDSLFFSHISHASKIVVVQSLENKLEVVLTRELFNLEEIVITPQVNSLKVLADLDFQRSPVSSSQDVLRKVPGLFIGQHAGGGKAEQIFLRGFDIDHGTDIAIGVDGLPVNMVSHAHGQGYADLHFLIPETIQKIDFGKGSYYADQGNFNTAGYVDFQTKRRLDHSIVKLEGGQFNTFRFMTLLDLVNSKKHNAFLATEYLTSDGPFESSQNLQRVNLFGKYSGQVSKNSNLEFLISSFFSDWDASGQIPQRAVDSGLISRFGAIDDTEGGSTSRNNFSLKLDHQLSESSSLSNQVYLSTYDFELFSNFTFFLEDPIGGDQIRQRENRTILGLNSEYKKNLSISNLDATLHAGLTVRYDQSRDNELAFTLNRNIVQEQLAFGDINEFNVGAYLATEIDLGKWTFNPSLRFDFFNFDNLDRLVLIPSHQVVSRGILSPKLNINYNQSRSLQWYIKAGKGFHSNDTRVVVARETENILPAAYSGDIGLNWKPSSKVLINAAYWNLFLQQEFVYVGDAGIVEPSGQTFRQGVDFSIRYQALDVLFFTADASYTLARAIEEAEGEQFIPLAPDFTFVGGIDFIHPSGVYANLNLRYLDDRPANEDNSIVAEGYTVTDLNFGMHWEQIGIGIQIQNLFDVDWNETQFATESRLFDELNPVEEIHFTPGTPFFIKGVLEYKF